MKYTVKLTPHAIAEISETIAYISHVLLVPDTARAWADHLQSEISGLDTLPERYPQVEREPWHRLGIRKMPVKNFIVYYYVWITATVYAKRDQLNALKNMPLS